MSTAILTGLIALRIFSIVILITALILACVIPKDSSEYSLQVESKWKAARTAAIVFFSINMAISLLCIALQAANFFVLKTSRLFTIIINVFDLFMSLSLIGVSIPLIAADPSLPSTVYEKAVNNPLYLLSGIFGIIALVLCILDLFLSRFYQFSVYEDSWYDDLWEYIYQYIYPIPPTYYVE